MQAAQQGQSAELEARLAVLEAGACADSPRRMTQDIAELGTEAVRAEDLNSILGRLVGPPIEPPQEELCTFHLRDERCIQNRCIRHSRAWMVCRDVAPHL